MTRTDEQRILGTLPAEQFVGRATALDRLTAHADREVPAGLAVIAAPGSGSSELIRQTYDRLFYQRGEVIPFYFAVRATDRGPREAAERFLHGLLTQTIAFRLNDPSIIDSAPELDELSELSVAADDFWMDPLIRSARSPQSDADDEDHRSYVRTLLSAPLRAATHGARIFVMLDDVDRCMSMSGGNEFFDELKDIYSNCDIPYLFAGARRFLFGELPADTLNLEPLSFEAAGQLADALAVRTGVELNEQTRDLIAVQLGGYPAHMASLFAAAAERGKNFDNFKSVETVYTDEIFGGRICRSLDALLEQIVPESARSEAVKLLVDGLDADGGKLPLAYWRKHLGLSGRAFRQTLALLNVNEIISVNGGKVFSEMANIVLSDYLRGCSQLERPDSSRALVVGDAMTEYIQRAPRLLARLYRRNSAVGLRSLLGAFDYQEIPKAAIDYAKFKEELKGLSRPKMDVALAAATEKITLPQIVYTAHTSAFYSKIGELIEDERSTIALGFEEADFRDKVVWVAAEIDSKLEANADLTEFWCDRLEMVAINCGFAHYKLWLVAPEGFSDESLEILRQRGAIGSSRKQIQLLLRTLTGSELAADPLLAVDEYEIVVPMGDDTEMIAAHAVEDIAKRHNFPAKTINQIKTALVEACINATEHSLSPDRRIYQKFAVDEEKITITVANRGIRLLDKTVREVTPHEGRRGWGFRLLKGLMDEVKIEQSDDGTRVTMVKYVKPAE